MNRRSFFTRLGGALIVSKSSLVDVPPSPEPRSGLAAVEYVAEQWQPIPGARWAPLIYTNSNGNTGYITIKTGNQWTQIK